MIIARQLGKNPVLVVEFGTGDIEMVRTVTGKDGVTILAFKDLDVPKEIGSVHESGYKDLKDMGPVVMFTFSKVSSIDSLISMLEGCKAEITPSPEPKKSK